MQSYVSAVEAYRDVVKNPVLDKARISHKGDSVLLRTVWSQRDIDRHEKTSLLKTYLLQDDGAEKVSALCTDSFPQEIGANELWRAESPSGSQLAVLRSCKTPSILDKSASQEERFYLELFEEDRRVRTVDLQAFDAHGRVYDNDLTFGCFEWSHSEGHLLYVAEQKRDKSTSYFDQKGANESRAELQMSQSDVLSKLDYTGAQQSTKRGQQYDYVDNWGEQLTEKSRSGLFLYNLDANAVSRVENVPSGVSPGTALWAPDDEGIVYVGYEEEPFRLGIVYCVNRPSSVSFLKFARHDDKDTEPERLSRLDASVRSPRFSPDQSRLIWLECELGGPHGQCARVVLCDWRTKRVATVIDTVACCASRTEFAGVYCDVLPARCWLSDSRRVVLHTMFGSSRNAVCIDVLDRVGRRLTRSGEANERRSVSEEPLAMFGSYSVLDVDPVSDLVVGAASAPNKPDHLVLGRLRFAGSPAAIDQFRFMPVAPAQLRIFEEISWTIETHWAAEQTADGDCEHRATASQCASRFESFLLVPSGVQKIASEADSTDNGRHPLIVVVHGGPHSGAATEFSAFNAAWCLLGYAVLVVNYRGSLGFGTASIDSLVGRIGENDVADCVQAIEAVCSKYSQQIDSANVYVTGGSHGGFLTAHLLARLGARVRAGAARNPVTNLYSMIATTDIPDWVFTEGVANKRKQSHEHEQCEHVSGSSGAAQPAYTRYTPGRLPDEQELLELRRRSPVTSVVQNIDTISPLLIMLGELDMRVHPKQGQELYRILRAYQRTTKLIVYPQNNHPLSKVEAESDSFVNITEWFRQFAA